MTLRATSAVLTLLAACASETPELDRRTAFDDSAGTLVVTVLGDGFVRSGDRRIPLEAIVLELRQRVRAMPAEAMQRFVVQVLAEPQAEAATERLVRQDIDRLLDQLYIMGVRQVRLF